MGNYLCCTNQNSNNVDHRLNGIVNFGQDIQEDPIFMTGMPNHRENKKLCDAIAEGRFDRVKELVKNGAKVNVKSMDSQNRSPLHVAVLSKQPEICKYLISSGAKINQLDCLGASALFWAVKKGCKETALTLLDGGDCAVNTEKKIPFHAATSMNDVEMMHILFTRGADPEQKGILGLTPLHICALNGNLSAAKFLVVGICVSLEPKNDRNETPFHLAMTRRHRDVLDLLVMAGCDIRQENSIYDRLPHWLMGVDDELKLTQKYSWFNRNSRSLQDLCVFRIRRHLGRRLPNVVDTLPCPDKLKTLLKLTDIPQCYGRHSSSDV